MIGRKRPPAAPRALLLVVGRHFAGEPDRCEHAGVRRPVMAAGALSGVEACPACILARLREHPDRETICDGCATEAADRIEVVRIYLGRLQIFVGLCPDCLGDFPLREVFV